MAENRKYTEAQRCHSIIASLKEGENRRKRNINLGKPSSPNSVKDHNLLFGIFVPLKTVPLVNRDDQACANLEAA